MSGVSSGSQLLIGWLLLSEGSTAFREDMAAVRGHVRCLKSPTGPSLKANGRKPAHHVEQLP